ncbi:Asp/Glu racemase [Sulfitobacter sp. M57]|uniref:maleate cis-trans isomerase family protein n=1 Tax=unclassified Sulfitobacter TaxID=196795 RepID=UPI0023E19782|nr:MULTISPECIES: Asp/Glu racemase [unclassified Sulfitobacter]MDF3415496.1 Asp/Glu racemase [Sulfitobacter sp. KE5]MDF3422977.1 Asp/Glu racemase [Sulfitobacter sp. KE43]MDF3434042.1 Asp/Glu racemase [Sulfitobacter sp. KE42]MDF3459925.1 Asp/Glu racemase [Sulfitobacter sp. S74]MDF3463581.1 Asp/Glu racemase [Sulfitobacter sp. Ks18]
MGLPYSLSSDRPVQLGLVVLQSDETLERDMRQLLPLETEVLISRVASGTELDTAMIAGMEGRLTGAAELLPRGAQIAAVGYGCTSATAQIGAARVGDLIKAGVPTPHVTDPVTALIAACSALGVSRLGMITPYVANVSDQLRVVIEAADIRVSHFASFEEKLEENVVRIKADAIINAAIDMAKDSSCDAVFLSCTNLRTLGVITEIETEIGKPVLSSNQVLAWHLMRLGGVTPPEGLPGRLWQV